MRRSYQDNGWKCGERYAFITKETCICVAQKARACGHEVRYGTTDSGSYYFEIVDPFEDGDSE